MANDVHRPAAGERLLELNDAAPDRLAFRASLTPEQVRELDRAYLERERDDARSWGNAEQSEQPPTPAPTRRNGAAHAAPREPATRKPQPPNDRADAPRAAPRRQRKQSPADAVAAPRKECPREILWLNQLLGDGELPAGCFRLGYVIAQLWSRHTGYANPAQTTIAEVLQLSERTVRRLIGPLVERGHLEVVSTGLGRGHTSSYRPIINKPERPFVISKRAR